MKTIHSIFLWHQNDFQRLSGYLVAMVLPLFPRYFFFANNNVFLSFLVSVPRKRPTIDYQFRQTSKDSIRNLEVSRFPFFPWKITGVLGQNLGLLLFHGLMD